MNQETHEYIKGLESSNSIDPNCATCREVYYPPLEGGKKMWEIFAPRHKALATCKSGGYPHCTCDTCF